MQWMNCYPCWRRVEAIEKISLIDVIEEPWVKEADHVIVTLFDGDDKQVDSVLIENGGVSTVNTLA